MSTSRMISPAVSAPARRRWMAWVGGVVGVALLAATAVFGYLAWQMSVVPADLDYAATQLSAAGQFRVTYTPARAPIPINQMQTWTLHVETAAGQSVDDAVITIAGDMPQHGHGLPTKPQVTQALGGGDYRVEGLKFQMGGWWQMAFTVTAGGRTDTVTFNLMLQK